MTPHEGPCIGHPWQACRPRVPWDPESAVRPVPLYCACGSDPYSIDGPCAGCRCEFPPCVNCPDEPASFELRGDFLCDDCAKRAKKG